MEKKIIHLKRYDMEKGWVVLCGKINWDYSSENIDMINCDCCLEAYVKSKGGTYEDWETLLKNKQKVI